MISIRVAAAGMDKLLFRFRSGRRSRFCENHRTVLRVSLMDVSSTPDAK